MTRWLSAGIEGAHDSEFSRTPDLCTPACGQPVDNSGIAPVCSVLSLFFSVLVCSVLGEHSSALVRSVFASTTHFGRIHYVLTTHLLRTQYTLTTYSVHTDYVLRTHSLLNTTQSLRSKYLIPSTYPLRTPDREYANGWKCRVLYLNHLSESDSPYRSAFQLTDSELLFGGSRKCVSVSLGTEGPSTRSRRDSEDL